MFDAAIIGCGISGAAIARELSKYDLTTVIIEKENDVAMGATRANSAIVHAGYDAPPGTLMAKLNVRGNELTKELCARLSVPYKNIGSLLLAFSDEEAVTVQKLYERGLKNGVPDMRILTFEETKALEPNISDEVKAALYAPSAGIVNPWEFAVALAETAVQNGAKLMLGSEVTAIERGADGFHITAGGETLKAKYVINAAGVNAGKLHDMALPHAFDITPNKGAYFVLDKSEGELVKHVIFQCPSKAGKGVLVSPTVHGNLIIGPNALDVKSDETEVLESDLSDVRKAAVRSIPSVDFRQNIRCFAGVRPNSTVEDFIIGAHDGFIDVAGIRSPGLTAAPGIAEYVAVLMRENGAKLTPRSNFIDRREHVRFKDLTHEQRAALVKENPLYGRVICRCETVTEGEIVNAIRSPIPPRTIDGVKRRCEAGLGRCQGGFCGPRVLEILSRELHVPRESIQQDKNGSYIVTIHLNSLKS
ncbi:MAG: NAD(P)/FAD-dependent oxidoreductase [Oscillospiraceae bacterium]|nr:NAD(P)/FAD-dependent oxidoreductase [Oscillospiraceae bacterium]